MWMIVSSVQSMRDQFFLSIFISLSLYLIMLITISISIIKFEKLIYRKRAKANDTSLSLIYIKQLRKNTNFVILITLGYIFCIFFFKKIIIYLSLKYIALFILGFNLLLVKKELLIKYRIHKGLFGTNHTEARELINFIIKNSDNLDFTDSNGNLRRALLPEAKDAAEEHIPGTLGEEAPA